MNHPQSKLPQVIDARTPLIATAAAIWLVMLVGNTLAVAQDRSATEWAGGMAKINAAIGEPFPIDEARARAAGIRKLSSRHLDLYTDVPARVDIDELPAVFDQAIVGWCEFFEVPARRAAQWKMRAFLITDRATEQRFRQAGLIPADLPEFAAGLQRRHNLWLYLQPGDYYTRHLLLHEGTHGFMNWFAGGYGAPWYSEGMAEQFGLHRWADNELSMRHRLRDRQEASFWGRIKRLRDDRQANESLTLTDVFNIEPTAFRDVRYYAWAWAACEFLSHHADAQDSFAKLRLSADLASIKFNQELLKAIEAKLPQLESDWELFLEEVDFGYEVARGRLLPAQIKAQPLANTTTYSLRTDHSWQHTDIELKRGDRVQISATGEFIVHQPQPSDTEAATDDSLAGWRCQANGITIEYYRGAPLGVLQAGLWSPADDGVVATKHLRQPLTIGLSNQFEAQADGRLCLRINESPAKMDDNSGDLEVTVEKLK